MTVYTRVEEPLIAETVNNRDVRIFLGTGSSINLITTNTLRKIMSGFKVVELLTFSLRGVTGNKLKARGHIKLYVFLDGINVFETDTVVIYQSVFPDLLIGFPIMYEQDISIITRELGAKYFYKFIPFISKDNNSREKIKFISDKNNVYLQPINTVAERSRLKYPKAEISKKQRQKKAPLVGQHLRGTNTK